MHSFADGAAVQCVTLHSQAKEEAGVPFPSFLPSMHNSSYGRESGVGVVKLTQEESVARSSGQRQAKCVVECC